MQSGQPSRTALGAAFHRAAHQVLDGGFIFSDPLAAPILGTDDRAIVLDAGNERGNRILRLFIAVRSRFAEDALAAAVRGGAGQVVILGAGLDTFAYRAAPGGNVRIFEVDYPATQGWKRRRLAEAGIDIPPSLTFAPIDFERQTLADGLAAAGFDAERATFFTWLGVVPYLTEGVVFSTLGFIAGLRAGAQVVFDYGNPAAPGENAHAVFQKALAERVASVGEPFKISFETAELHVKLAALGFGEIEDLGPALIAERYLGISKGVLPDRGGHIVRAARIQ